MTTNPVHLSKERRDALILEHYSMVERVAYRMARRFPSSVEADDLVAIGTLGLIDAVDKFSASREVSFSAYARIRVQGAILDELRKDDWVPRSVRNRNTHIRRSKEDLRRSLGRDPSSEELASSMDVDVDRLHEMVRTSALRTLVSMEEKAGTSDEPIGNSLRSTTLTPDEIALKKHVGGLVRRAMADLPERERQLLDLYYYKDMTFSQIGEVLGVTESRVSQIHTRVKSRLRSRMQALI